MYIYIYIVVNLSIDLYIYIYICLQNRRKCGNACALKAKYCEMCSVVALLRKPHRLSQPPYIYIYKYREREI